MSPVLDTLPRCKGCGRKLPDRPSIDGLCGRCWSDGQPSGEARLPTPPTLPSPPSDPVPPLGQTSISWLAQLAALWSQASHSAAEALSQVADPGYAQNVERLALEAKALLEQGRSSDALSRARMAWDTAQVEAEVVARLQGDAASTLGDSWARLLPHDKQAGMREAAQSSVRARVFASGRAAEVLGELVAALEGRSRRAA